MGGARAKVNHTVLVCARCATQSRPGAIGAAQPPWPPANQTANKESPSRTDDGTVVITGAHL